MGVIWRLATSTSEDREKLDESKYTWADYAKNILNIIVFFTNTFFSVTFFFSDVAHILSLLILCCKWSPTMTSFEFPASELFRKKKLPPFWAQN